MTSYLNILIAALLSTAPAQADDWTETGKQVVSLVRERFFDKARAEAWADEHARYAENVHNVHDFAKATRDALQKLGASHTDFYTADDPQYYGLTSIFREPLKLKSVVVESIGVDVAPGNFVRVVFAGSPAEKAGLRRGDKILNADGREFHPVLSFRGRADQPVTLFVQSRRDGPTREVAVFPRMIEPRQEWLEAQKAGAKIFEVRGRKVAYMPFFSAAGEPHLELLRAEIVDRFAEADALILDFRDGWGGASPAFLNVFNRTPPVFEQITQDGTRARYDAQWRKPLFILINGGSRSGKELVAYAIQKHKIGTLVGERTAGAVLAGSPFMLRDQTVLYLAVADVLVDGERLEGRGIVPDVEVIDSLPFAAGKDPQLEKALELAGS